VRISDKDVPKKFEIPYARSSFFHLFQHRGEDWLTF